MSGTHEENPILYVLSNELHIRGAACIIYKDYLAEVAERLNCDFYISPSSIHEMILIPKIESMNPKEIQEVIREINRNLVDDEEVLSNELYLYCLDKNELELWKEA